MGVGAFISVGKSLERAIDRVQRAEALGYESAFTTHIAGRDSMTVIASYAAATDRIRVGTGVMPIYSRSPVATAQSIVTVDELSGGRAVLGLGAAHKVTVEGWYGEPLEKPVRDMREYLSIVRTILRGEDPPTDGERFRSSFHFMGLEPRPDIPIYVGALSPRMLRTAGELADGVVLWLCNPDYIRDVVVPEVTKGRERAGRQLDGFDVVAAVPSAITDEPEQARGRMRGDLITYFSLPFYRAMLERAGFGEDIAGFDEGMARGDTQAAVGSISDRFLETLTAIGTVEEAEAGVRAYLEAGATSPCLGGVPGTDFDATLEQLAGLTG